MTTHWNHFGFLISISGVRNVLQSQEVFLMDDQIYFFILEINSIVIHQIVCILWDKSNGLVKNTYGCHPGDQERPPSIRKVPDNPPSGTSLKWLISVKYKISCIFKDKSIHGVSFNQGCHLYFMDQEGSLSSSIRKVLDWILFKEPMSVIYQIVCIFCDKSIGWVD